MRMIDISPELSEAIAVWPGDQKYQRRVDLDFSKGDNLVLSSILTTLHVGAHADAPSHYTPSGMSIESRPLEPYFGRCQLIRARASSEDGRLRPKDLNWTKIEETRVLFATGSFPDPNRFQENFHSLSPELIHVLADQGVGLIGIDTPSIDPYSSKALESHQAIAERNLSILEGLVLDHVEPGSYFLVALPLKLKGADAAPVRAVLVQSDLKF